MLERRNLRLGLAIVAVLAAAGLAAPLVAPYPPNEQLDPVGGAERPPGAVLAAVALADGRWYLVEEVERTADGLRLERAGRVERLGADEVLNLTDDGVADRRLFLLGSDRFSRDVLSRLLYGLRVSLVIGLAVVALALGLGLTVGALAALGGAVVDNLLMRGVEALNTFPRLFLLLTLAALFEPSNALLVLLLGATGWTGTSRLVRAELLGLAERPFVLAARASGASTWRLLFRHLLPNAMAPVLATASLLVGSAILAESSLSFLGFGLQPPQASLGNLLGDGRTTLATTWWLSVFPGVVIVAVVVGFNLLADGLRDLLDPRRSGRPVTPVDADPMDLPARPR